MNDLKILRASESLPVDFNEDVLIKEVIFNNEWVITSPLNLSDVKTALLLKARLAGYLFVEHYTSMKTGNTHYKFYKYEPERRETVLQVIELSLPPMLGRLLR